MAGICPGWKQESSPGSAPGGTNLRSLFGMAFLAFPVRFSFGFGPAKALEKGLKDLNEMCSGPRREREGAAGRREAAGPGAAAIPPASVLLPTGNSAENSPPLFFLTPPLRAFPPPLLEVLGFFPF